MIARNRAFAVGRELGRDQSGNIANFETLARVHVDDIYFVSINSDLEATFFMLQLIKSRCIRATLKLCGRRRIEPASHLQIEGLRTL